jgi:hypothetical protein
MTAGHAGGTKVLATTILPPLPVSTGAGIGAATIRMMKRLLPALSATLPFLVLCACGDPREAFVGSYNADGTITFVVDSARDTQDVATPLTIIADAFESDRLYLDFDCGMSATMGAPGFLINQEVCPPFEEDSCTIVWTYKNGGGTKEEGAPLKLNPGGIIKGRCTDGSSGELSFFFTLTGTPRTPGSEDPGAQSTRRHALRTTFRQAFERAMRAAHEREKATSKSADSQTDGRARQGPSGAQ